VVREHSTAGFEVGLLGPLRVWVAGRPLELPAGRLPALLAVLAMSAGEPVSVDRLATAVWGEGVSVDARANLQTNVRRLRRLLGAELIATRGGGYALAVAPDQVDALRFVRLLDLAAAAPDRAAQRGRLVDALALWRGTPFDGCDRTGWNRPSPHGCRSATSPGWSGASTWTWSTVPKATWRPSWAS
jgi:DNA-binding SARP family transcriptional activator